jgi:proteasome assembly chaperone (PAC2) family protein
MEIVEGKLTEGENWGYHSSRMGNDQIIYTEKPNLDQPYLIMGFEGWPNAAEVSSFALTQLIESTKARKFASLPYENFYQLSSSRLVGVVKEGKLGELSFPGNHFYYLKNSPSNDLILFYGIEPHLQWNAFSDLFLDLAEQFRVREIFMIGGTYDYIPHTVPPVVSALYSHEDLKKKVIHAGLALTEYSGPVSIHTFVLDAARKRGFKAISLWGHAPQYLQTKNVKVAYSVLKSLADLTGMAIDLTELQRASDFFDQQVSQLVEQDPKLHEVVKKLEELYQQADKFPSFLKNTREEQKKDDNVVYIQAFLKRQEDEEKK